jgi:hypothetical protein
MGSAINSIVILLLRSHFYTNNSELHSIEFAVEMLFSPDGLEIRLDIQYGHPLSNDTAKL